MLELSTEDLLKELNPVFYPQSIAVVGASPKSQNSGSGWVQGLVNAGFKGDIYPVNPRGGSLLGLKVYPSLISIPGNVDYVIVAIPREAVPSILDECAAKRVKAVHFFTAGYGELGDAKGHELEADMVQKARRGGFHIIGPNCIGSYCPESKIAYSPLEFLGESGAVGFVSQSGGIGCKLIEIGIGRGINFSKGISFGNGVDLDAIDFLRYMTADPKTSVIGVYLEGANNGRHMLDAMKETTKVKPLVVLKGGRTEVGAAAASSHTASLASPMTTWSAAVKQAGAIEVSTIEELADTLLIFQQLGRWRGKGVAIIGGLADGGGGISVTGGDICSEEGLAIPSLTVSTRERIANILGRVGSILHNPVDVSQAGSSLAIFEQVFGLVLADPVIDILIVQEDIGILLKEMPLDDVEVINNSLASLRTTTNKPVVIVLPPGTNEMERLQIEKKLARASIPVFPAMEHAARAIFNISRYSQLETELGN